MVHHAPGQGPDRFSIPLKLKFGMGAVPDSLWIRKQLHPGAQKAGLGKAFPPGAQALEGEDHP